MISSTFYQLLSLCAFVSRMPFVSTLLSFLQYLFELPSYSFPDIFTFYEEKALQPAVLCYYRHNSVSSY